MLSANQRVILTCRTNFFESQQDILTFLSGAIQKGLHMADPNSVKALFEIKYLAELSQSEIQEFINKALGDADGELFSKIFWTYDLENLSNTPIILSWLLKILPKTNNKNIRSRDSIYRSLINSWLKREAIRGANQKAIVELMKIIAEDMILRNATEISSIALSEKIQHKFLQKNLPQTSLANLDSMVRLSGFLSRDLNGNYFFTHRSIMEYFFAMVLEDKIKENYLTFYRDDEHLLYPDFGDIAFGLGPGFSKKNAAGPILEKINLDQWQ